MLASVMDAVLLLGQITTPNIVHRACTLAAYPRQHARMLAKRIRAAWELCFRIPQEQETVDSSQIPIAGGTNLALV